MLLCVWVCVCVFSFDNYYITPEMYAIDDRRAKLGKDRVFPLRASEKTKYIPLFSYRMTKKEIRKLTWVRAFFVVDLMGRFSTQM